MGDEIYYLYTKDSKIFSVHKTSILRRTPKRVYFRTQHNPPFSELISMPGHGYAACFWGGSLDVSEQWILQQVYEAHGSATFTRPMGSRHKDDWDYNWGLYISLVRDDSDASR